MIFSAGWQLREARRNQFENLHQFYLIERCYKNVIECPSYMCKIRQINRLVKLYFVTHVLERLSMIWIVLRWWVFKAQRSYHSTVLVSFVVNLIVKTFTERLFQNKYQTFSWTKNKRNIKLMVIYFCPLCAWVSVISHSRFRN